MKDEKLYKEQFYANRDDHTRYSAERILSIILTEITTPQNVVDIGCGVGTWLSVAQSLGVASIDGYDGPWVVKDYLQIPAARFHENDLAEQLALETQFDLGISLEVFEHLPADIACQRLDHVLEHCRFMLFGAAVPQQGGTGHINERPQSYWHDYIIQRGFVGYDLVRPQVWADPKIPYWYKQNPLFYVRSGEVQNLSDNLARYKVSDQTLLDVIHPGLLNKHWRRRQPKSLIERIKKPFKR